MHLVSCEHPQYLRAKTGEIIQVRCGQCGTCRCAKASKWVDLLDQECQAHKYSYMFNLTYDDDHLPVLYFDDDMKSVSMNRQNSKCIPIHELLTYCIDEDGKTDNDSVEYLRDRLTHPLGLPCVCPKDFSDFLKRFNKYCFSHVTHTYENFRYFICHEYGPSTYRCHGHGIMFFDNDQIARRFDEILHSCWTLGDCSGSAIYSYGGRTYVAQYVNMSMHLPAIYRHPALRQRQQFSKSPTIGSFGLSPEKIRDFYDRVPPTRVVWKSEAAKYDVVPIDSSVKSRLFEKCQGYSELTFNERVGLYGATECIPSETFKEFCASLSDVRWLDSRSITNYDEHQIIKVYNFLLDNCRDNSAFESSLKRWFSLSKRVVWYSRIIGFSVRYIVSRIDEFYRNLDYYNLCNMYKFQSAYAKMYPSSDLIWMYPELSKALKDFLGDFKQNDVDIGLLPYSIYEKLESFGITKLNDLRSFHDTFDYKAMSLQSFKIYKDTHKRKAANDYRDGKLSFTDPHLARILRKYQNSNQFTQNYGET